MKTAPVDWRGLRRGGGREGTGKDKQQSKQNKNMNKTCRQSKL